MQENNITKALAFWVSFDNIHQRDFTEYVEQKRLAKAQSPF